MSDKITAASPEELRQRGEELKKEATKVRLQADQRAKLLEAEGNGFIRFAEEVSGIERQRIAVENGQSTVTGSASKRRGRPPKSAVAVATATDGKRRGRPPGSKNKSAAEKAADEKTQAKRAKARNERVLDDVVLEVLKESGKEMRIKDVVIAVRKKGYKSNAEKFEQIVYQKLLKLSSDPAVATKNKDDDRKTVFKAAA
jgi:hypothetical protein